MIRKSHSALLAVNLTAAASTSMPLEDETWLRSSGQRVVDQVVGAPSIRNLVPSTHMRCRIPEILRANAIMALFRPRRFATWVPQVLGHVAWPRFVMMIAVCHETSGNRIQDAPSAPWSTRRDQTFHCAISGAVSQAKDLKSMGPDLESGPFPDSSHSCIVRRSVRKVPLRHIHSGAEIMKIGFVTLCFLLHFGRLALGAGTCMVTGVVGGSYPEVDPIMLWSFAGAGLAIGATYLGGST